MDCDVDTVCSELVMGRRAALRLDGSSELDDGTVTGDACSGLTARLQPGCRLWTGRALADAPGGWYARAAAVSQRGV